MTNLNTNSLCNSPGICTPRRGVGWPLGSRRRVVKLRRFVEASNSQKILDEISKENEKLQTQLEHAQEIERLRKENEALRKIAFEKAKQLGQEHLDEFKKQYQEIAEWGAGHCGKKGKKEQETKGEERKFKLFYRR
eukprot:TRINITY_DN58699_c1_g1_i1.p1 TRINITY_DN58699_c1_g1~~TRINITY_DN58699_c1_g1_i1.p1  ORF type:complete len:136 (-),score=26.25 TRINITY_DN58699_c1_g1_i1:9-416(-)